MLKNTKSWKIHISKVVILSFSLSFVLSNNAVFSEMSVSATQNVIPIASNSIQPNIVEPMKTPTPFSFLIATGGGPTPTPTSTPSSSPWFPISCLDSSHDEWCCCDRGSSQFDWDMMYEPDSGEFCRNPLNTTQCGASYLIAQSVRDGVASREETEFDGWSGPEIDAVIHLWGMCWMSSCLGSTFSIQLGWAHERDENIYPWEPGFDLSNVRAECAAIYQDLDNNALAVTWGADYTCLDADESCRDRAISSVQSARELFPNEGVGSGGGDTANIGQSHAYCGIYEAN